MIKTNTPKEFEDLYSASRSLNESNDCTVKAVALVCGVTYQEAHAEMKRRGRKDRRGAFAWQYKAAVEHFGKRIITRTANEFISQYPGIHKTLSHVTSHHPRRFPGVFSKDKVYLLRSRSHVLAVIGGEVKDWSINKSLRIIDIWEVV